MHAGAIGTDGGAVLVVGRGGRGKSTTTLAGLGAGLKYVGDDYVAVETKDRPLVHSIYNAGKLEPHHLERFPVLREHATIDPPGLDGDFEQPKAVVYVHAQFPQRRPRVPGSGVDQVGDLKGHSFQSGAGQFGRGRAPR